MLKPFLPIFLLAFAIVVHSYKASSQEYDLEDTIRLSERAHAELKFASPPEVIPYTSEYWSESIGNAIKIRPRVSHPATGWIKVKVKEKGGTRKSFRLFKRKSSRLYKFILIYDKDVNYSEQNYDYSTPEMIRLRKEQNAAAKMADPNRLRRKEAQPIEQRKAVIDQDEPKQAVNPKIIKGQQLLHGIPREDLEERVVFKLQKFNELCTDLCDKYYGSSKNTRLNRGLKYLFENKEEVIIQTRNPKTGKTNEYKIRRYLERMIDLPYQQIIVKTYDVRFITEFVRKESGDYEGTAIILQDFGGYRDGRLAYSDRTEKAVKIIVKIYTEVDEAGEVKDMFDIYLGNMSVTNIPAGQQ